MTTRIDILLATYNGARFLPEQLQSLLGQTHSDWRLIVRDDGSSDRSRELVGEWARDHGVECEMLDDGLGNIGACASFGKLLEATDAPYFACCDQDDVWLPEKLGIMLKAVRTLETPNGAQTPLLAYSDLVLVDGELNRIAGSFRQHCSIASIPSSLPLRRLLVHNVVTGCATLGNNTLARLAAPIPEGTRMHDWWLALVAAEFGRLIDVPVQTALYRQHGRNTLGAARLGTAGALSRFAAEPLAVLKTRAAIIEGEKRQARAFHDRFLTRLSDTSREIARGYGYLDERGFLARKAFVIRNGLKRHNLLSQLTFLATV
ncbi:hypothetical protein A9D14_09550 [Croceicoccus marinus]|uniref:Glycosyltransferase 2-like domain-containing protein n=1 Tax=Croceicoccus marinus TaxID=450378 RepID=A0A1Z1FC40_9SPHN|nr:hypothetical protein A9D14_09550 [Croceicoccus marinus]